MNNMDAVRRLLTDENGQGVEEDEIFNIAFGGEFIKYNSGVVQYKFGENEVGHDSFLESFNGLTWTSPCSNLLERLLKDDGYHIVKLPFRPKKGETYYRPYITSGTALSITALTFAGDLDEYAMLKLHWVFRTEEECEKALPRIQAEIEKMKEEKK
jgi:hypothetical protein